MLIDSNKEFGLMTLPMPAQCVPDIHLSFLSPTMTQAPKTCQNAASEALSLIRVKQERGHTPCYVTRDAQREILLKTSDGWRLLWHDSYLELKWTCIELAGP